MEWLGGVALILAGTGLFAAGSLGWLAIGSGKRLNLVGLVAYLLIGIGTVLVVIAALS